MQNCRRLRAYLNQWRETLKLTNLPAKSLLISKKSRKIYVAFLDNLLSIKTTKCLLIYTAIGSDFWQERASNLDATPHLSIILAERQYIRTLKPLYPTQAFQTVQSVGER